MKHVSVSNATRRRNGAIPYILALGNPIRDSKRENNLNFESL